MTGTNHHFKTFLQNIRQHNSALQTKSFYGSETRHENFMSSFKIQGQFYQTSSWLLNMDKNMINRELEKDHWLPLLGQSGSQCIQCTWNRWSNCINIVDEQRSNK